MTSPIRYLLGTMVDPNRIQWMILDQNAGRTTSESVDHLARNMHRGNRYRSIYRKDVITGDVPLGQLEAVLTSNPIVSPSITSLMESPPDTSLAMIRRAKGVSTACCMTLLRGRAP